MSIFASAVIAPDRVTNRACLPAVLLALVGLSGCAPNSPLAQCEGDVRVLNAGKWPSTQNDLKSSCLTPTVTVASINRGSRS